MKKRIAFVFFIYFILVLTYISFIWYKFYNDNFSTDFIGGLFPIILLFGLVYYFIFTVWSYRIMVNTTEIKSLRAQLVSILTLGILSSIVMLIWIYTWAILPRARYCPRIITRSLFLIWNILDKKPNSQPLTAPYQKAVFVVRKVPSPNVFLSYRKAWRLRCRPSVSRQPLAVMRTPKKFSSFIKHFFSSFDIEYEEAKV